MDKKQFFNQSQDKSQLLFNAYIVDPYDDTSTEFLGYVIIDVDGIIAEVKEGAPPENFKGLRQIDCQGKILAPAFLDMSVTLGDLMRAQLTNHTKQFARAAHRGGVVSAVVTPSKDNLLDDVRQIQAFTAVQQMPHFGQTLDNESDVDVRQKEVVPIFLYCYGAMTKGRLGQQLGEYGLMQLAGALGFFDSFGSPTTADMMWRILHYAKNFNALIIMHPEDYSLSYGKDMNSGFIASQLGLSGNPAISEAVQLQRDLTLLSEVGGRYHVTAVSTKRAVELIRNAKKNGLPVTADTAPIYFSLNETAVGDYLTHAKVSPPLRSEADRLAVIEGLMDGTIDVIASSHQPLHDDKKRLPFSSADYGVVGIETMFSLAMTILHHQFGMPIKTILEKLTYNPAKVLNLNANYQPKSISLNKNDKKFFSYGRHANLVLIDKVKTDIIDSSKFLSPSKNTPLDNFVIKSVVIKTWVKGNLVYQSKVNN